MIYTTTIGFKKYLDTRLDATFRNHTRKAREKNPISQESNKFAKLLNLTLKEIDIKDRTIEAENKKKQKHKERIKSTRAKSIGKHLEIKKKTLH